MRFSLLALIAILLPMATYAQEDSIRLHIKGYIDTYYATFSDSAGPDVLQPYTTVSPRDKRIGLNVAQLGVHYADPKVRANLTLHFGDIAEATWSETFRQVQEANAGFLLGRDWWVDAGFFATHIGTESFLPKNNYLSSTAVATYNEPFYQAGARLSYEGSERYHLELWVTNGYNYFLDANDAKSFGLLFTYNFSENTSLTYTNLFGRESADEAPVAQYRTYQNLYLNTRAGEKLYIVAGGDLGTQSHSNIQDSTSTALMFNALLTLRYQHTDAFSLTGRYEVFHDPDGFISGLLPAGDGRREGLQVQGITLGAEYRPMSTAYLRPEVRYLRSASDMPIFISGAEPERGRWEAMITMGLYFTKQVK
ncbi:outer membrane beta-barrel protein [Roseivirga sp. BDSF3-8]|uniref:outer membrane beta-barrel protein n=1 Tax=Roseivirga sp. BDSF3-8 TaxID=3241598 RepID=UPI0035326EC1